MVLVTQSRDLARFCMFLVSFENCNTGLDFYYQTYHNITHNVFVIILKKWHLESNIFFNEIYPPRRCCPNPMAGADETWPRKLQSTGYK